MVVAACPRCATLVALHEGRPWVNAAGSIDLWHRACFDARDIPVAPPAAYAVVAPPVASRRLQRGVLGAVIASSIVSMGIAQWSWAEIAPAPPAAVAVVQIDSGDALPVHAVVALREPAVQRPAEVETALEAKHPVPTMASLVVPGMAVPGIIGDERPLDEAFPTLHDWVHPVTASAEFVPEQQARQFGEPRIAITKPRADCGQGHCGIDLDGPEGRPVVAVAAGVVVHVERHELGLDGMSGRYVRIQHDDGTLTSYMHLDDVQDGLEAGDHVAAGEYIGTLGSTATFEAPAHLHFALEIPNFPGARDLSDTHFVDPSPFLVRSTIVPKADRRRAERPAF